MKHPRPTANACTAHTSVSDQTPTNRNGARMTPLEAHALTRTGLRGACSPATPAHVKHPHSTPDGERLHGSRIRRTCIEARALNQHRTSRRMLPNNAGSRETFALDDRQRTPARLTRPTQTEPPPPIALALTRPKARPARSGTEDPPSDAVSRETPALDVRRIPFTTSHHTSVIRVPPQATKPPCPSLRRASSQ